MTHEPASPRPPTDAANAAAESPTARSLFGKDPAAVIAQAELGQNASAVARGGGERERKTRKVLPRSGGGERHAPTHTSRRKRAYARTLATAQRQKEELAKQQEGLDPLFASFVISKPAAGADKGTGRTGKW